MFRDGQTNVHNEEQSGRPSVVRMILFKVKDDASQFQNLQVNFHKFHSSLRDYHILARLSQVLRKMGSENTHRCAKNGEYGFGFDFFRVIPQSWQWISQSHHNR
jgi:hypothetical protein